MEGAATAKAKQIATSITVTRADGTVEDLGVVEYFSPSPWNRAKFALLKKLGRTLSVSDLFKS